MRSSLQKQYSIEEMADNCWAANRELLDRRWPMLARKLADSADNIPAWEIVAEKEQTLVIDGIQLTSSYNRGREAALQAALVPPESSRAWIYGMALGDLPRALLKRSSIEKLTVVILNPAIALLSLSCCDHRDWLADPRVVLSLADGKTAPQKPFAAAPGCLLLAEEQAAPLRDRIFLELATPFIHSKHQESPQILARLEANSRLVAQDGDVAELFGSRQKQSLVVAAAGPTLSDHYQWLQDRKLPLIAVDAALKPLLAAGIVPDWVVTIDGHEDIYRRFFEGIDLGALTDVPLIYFPTVATQVLEQWPGPRLACYPGTPPFRQLATIHPKAQLFSSGSVLHPAVDLAVQMGAARVILAGADFSFPDSRSHVAGSGATRFNTATGRHWVLNGFGQRVATSPSLRGFLRDLENYLEVQDQTIFVNTDRRGANIANTVYLEDVP